jgi:hypothetical protein
VVDIEMTRGGSDPGHLLECAPLARPEHLTAAHRVGQGSVMTLPNDSPHSEAKSRRARGLPWSCPLAGVERAEDKPRCASAACPVNQLFGCELIQCADCEPAGRLFPSPRVCGPCKQSATDRRPGGRQGPFRVRKGAVTKDSVSEEADDVCHAPLKLSYRP